jgi:dihydrofolate synthase/folylpolyglutamate synthase
MIASMLEAAGYRVGLYTSPHLETECERVQLWDGEHRMIDQSELDGLREKVKNTLHSEEPTVFEVYTAAAYLWFKEQAPDYVVLETGLGGRLDSTNTIEKPLVTVITQVGLDHTAELGNTIFRIAREKAGVIKDGVPVVSQTPDLSVKNILRRTASEKGAEFIDASDADQILSRFRKLSSYDAWGASEAQCGDCRCGTGCIRHRDI